MPTFAMLMLLALTIGTAEKETATVSGLLGWTCE
jgi:hypothetical protein